jgi:hypothetical protein
MPTLIWSVLCRSSSVDRDTNNISLFEVIEEMRIVTQSDEGTEGIAPLQCELLTLWRRSDSSVPEVVNQKVEITAPSGERIAGAETPIDLSTHVRSRIRIKIEALAIRGAGTYWFAILTTDGPSGSAVERHRVPLEIGFVADRKG